MKIPRSVAIIPSVSFFTFLLTFSTSVAGGQPDSDSLRFHWAFVAYPNPDTRPLYKPQVIERDTVLYSGDYFKLLVKPLTECYAYVFWYDSKKELKVLFPYTSDQFENDWKMNKQYNIPKGRDWYQLDQRKGQEELHLLVSRERLLDLEQSVDLYVAAGEEEKDALTLKVLNEIREVKKRFRMHRRFAERPAMIAGTIRGPLEEEKPTMMPPLIDIAKFAKEFEGETFYSKTLVIKHK